MGNPVYLTQERRRHILDGHPEMRECEEALRQTIRLGYRRQEPLAPQKFRYSRAFPGLSDGNTHVVAIVLFRLEADEAGMLSANNHIVTAFQKQIL